MLLHSLDACSGNGTSICPGIANPHTEHRSTSQVAHGVLQTTGSALLYHLPFKEVSSISCITKSWVELRISSPLTAAYSPLRQLLRISELVKRRARSPQEPLFSGFFLLHWLDSNPHHDQWPRKLRGFVGGLCFRYFSLFFGALKNACWFHLPSKYVLLAHPHSDKKQ